MENEQLSALLKAAPENAQIYRTLLVMDAKIDRYRGAVCSVSGGSDSDILVDLIEKVKGGREVIYAFYDTGMEYAATKRHLDELERKYGIRIEREPAVVPAPLGCKRKGQPFLSKQVSEFISRLQRHGFQWEDRPFEELYEAYPRCKAALRFWCNQWPEGSKANISQHKYLKEFMIENPPEALFSPYCCEGAKKKTAERINQKFSPGLLITGERQAEGGARCTAHSTCFDPAGDDGIAKYRPLFFWSDRDKEAYKAHYGIVHSDAYEVYGLSRTGCACCPFGSRFEQELEAAKKYEPRLYEAAQSVFRQSYDYTRRYRAFSAQRKAREREKKREEQP